MVLVGPLLEEQGGKVNRSELSLVPLLNEGSWVAAVSPHADDAGLSIGGILVALRPLRSLLLLTLTGGPEDGGHWTSRREEDAEFARSLGARHIAGSLLDARLKDVTREVIAPPLPYRIERMRGEMRCALLDLPRSAVFAPLGVGGHTDHLAASAASLALLRDDTAAVTLFLYEDMPYTAKQPAAVLSRIECLSDLGFELRPETYDVSPHLKAKLMNLLAYRSQRIERWLDLISDVFAFPPALRLWGARVARGGSGSPRPSPLNGLVART